MLTYTPHASSSTPVGNARPWLMLLLAFVWLWPGVFARDLWQPAEPAVFTTIAQWSPAHWAVPTLFGQVNWEISPLYYWLGVLGLHSLSPWLTDAYEAVRMANVLLMAIAFACIGGATRRFLGHRYGRTAVLVLLGCPGLLLPAHMMNSFPVLFTGCAMCWYGLALGKSRVMMASLMLGGGWVVLSLSGSLLLPLLWMAMAAALLLHPLWQQRRYRLVYLIAQLWAWPLMAAYPTALYLTDHTLFQTWWQAHSFAPLGGWNNLRFAFSLPYYLKNILWFALPAWPLAVWSAYKTRLWQSDWGAALLLWLAFAALLLCITPETHQDWLIITLPPLATAAVCRLDALRRGAVSFLNWFGIMAFGFAAVFLWIGFVAMNYGWPAELAERAEYFSPYYRYDVDYFPMIVACTLTPLWLWAVTRKHVRGRQAVVNWSAGTVLVWSLLLTLFLPWLDAAKSTRPVVQQMQHSFSDSQIAALQNGKDCVGVSAGNYTARIAWQQYGWLKLEPDHPECRYQLVMRKPHEQPPQGQTELWSGARPREKHDMMALWYRNPNAHNPTEQPNP